VRACNLLGESKPPGRNSTSEAALTNQLLFLVVSLGSFERIDLRLGFLFKLSMRGEIASAGFPFYGRIRIAVAKPSGGVLHAALAAFTLLYNRLASTTVVPAAGFCHEGTFCSGLLCCTNHDNHLQF
jgi:hypothetical protein